MHDNEAKAGYLALEADILLLVYCLCLFDQHCWRNEFYTLFPLSSIDARHL